MTKYLWRKAADLRWLGPREELLEARFGSNMSIIFLPNRRRAQIQVACPSRKGADALVREFGGHIEKLPADWLKRYARGQRRKPLKIGKRLIITNVGGTSLSRLRTRSRPRGSSHLAIPAGAAFGTGEHATTAMSLRLLEKLTRDWTPGWRMIDLGTGSGILALAGKRFGAGRIDAIDNDPFAISTARENARSNRVGSIHFRQADLRRMTFHHRTDIVSANLYSELLIEVLPKLKRSRWLILSGVLRTQEHEVTQALRRNRIGVVQVRRRWKWVAVLAKTI